MPNASQRAADNTWPIHGHEWAIHYLQRMINIEHANSRVGGRESDRGLRNAYLFLGPAHVGKSTLVRSMAQAMLCTGESVNGPCGKCRSCQLMARGQHPDLRVFAPTDKDGEFDRVGGELRRDAANEFIREASLRPVESRYKVFHIQDAHLANTTFGNKVLKTVEEPPEHVVICLTATDRSLLLPTIVSRCEVLELRPVATDTVKNALISDWNVDMDRAELLARLSGGRLGWAVQQLDDSGGVERRQKAIDDLQELVRSSRFERLRFSEKLSANRDSMRLFGMIELWVTWWRDVLLVQNGCGDAISNLDYVDTVEIHAHTLPTHAVQSHLDTLRSVERYLHHTVNTRMALDTLLLDMPRPST